MDPWTNVFEANSSIFIGSRILDAIHRRRKHLHVCGWLLALIRRLDSVRERFHIAKEKHLIPYYVTWEAWIQFVDQFLRLGDLERVNKRYHYGALRLSRLNKVCWLQGRIHGYRFPYQTYGEMLSMNMAPIGAATVYIAVVLTAMQVGPLPSWRTIARSNEYPMGLQSFLSLLPQV